jgi:hypothetical protein
VLFIDLTVVLLKDALGIGTTVPRRWDLFSSECAGRAAGERVCALAEPVGEAHNMPAGERYPPAFSRSITRV